MGKPTASSEQAPGWDRAIDALKAHTKESGFGDSPEDLERLFSNESDRGLVILFGSMIEDFLEASLLRQMRSDLNQTEKKKMFGSEAPLGSFSAKIHAAFSFGIVDRHTRKSLDAFREMRNACAHSRKNISFADKALVDVLRLIIGEVGLPKRKDGKESEAARHTFTLAAALMLQLLSVDGNPAKFTSEMNKMMKELGLPSREALRERRP